MNIKMQRSQAFLKELITEALSELNDNRINSLSVIDVHCSKGKYNAQVFMSPQPHNDNAKTLKALKNAEGILREYVLQKSGWFKCPHLDFIIDESIEKASKLDDIFLKIAKEKEHKKIEQENKQIKAR